MGGYGWRRTGVIAIVAAALAISGSTGIAATFEAAPCPTIEGNPQLEKARCGFLVVPENRAKPASRTIRLRVAILPAQSPLPGADPVVYMSGGPGTSAVGQAAQAAAIGLDRQHEVILMDQRGTGGSEPSLFCNEVQEGVIPRAISLSSYAASTRKLFVDAHRKCHQRLVAKGIDLNAYNTTENAADFADLRTALGLAQWNVFGISYGTSLALIYIREHPEGIRSLALDAVLPPDESDLGAVWVSQREGVINLFRACDAQAPCAKRYPDLTGKFRKLVRDLEAKPVTLDVKDQVTGKPAKVLVDGAWVMNWIGTATIFAKDIPDTLDRATRGDVGKIAEFRTFMAQAGSLSDGMNNSVLCSEWVAYEKPSNLLKQGKLAFPGIPRSVQAEAPGLPFKHDICKIWKVAKAPASVRAPLRPTSIPTIVLNGTFDTATGPSFASYTARALGNKPFVSIPGAGHGATVASPCARDVLASFWRTPSAPDRSCAAGLEPPPFDIQ